MKPQNILVTGVAGFIGYHLSNKLCSNGYNIIGIDNINDYYDTKLKKDRLNILNNNNNFFFQKVDVKNRNELYNIFNEYEIKYIIHLAAQAGVGYSLSNPQAYIDSNISGFLNILELAREYKINNVIYASSSSVYGGNNIFPFKENQKTENQLSLYGITKKTNELMGNMYSKLYSINTIGLRFFTVYGPWGRPDMALFKFTKAILEDKPIQVYNYGKHSRSFTYIDDIVESISRLLSKVINGDINKKLNNLIFNIGGYKSVELMKYIQCIENCTNKKAIIELLPLQLGDIEKTEADVSLLKEYIDYSPKITVEEGIPKFVSWFRKYYKL